MLSVTNSGSSHDIRQGRRLEMRIGRVFGQGLKNLKNYNSNADTSVKTIGAKCGYLGGMAPPQVWTLAGAVVLGSGTVEEAMVWQESTQTYRLQHSILYIRQWQSPRKQYHGLLSIFNPKTTKLILLLSTI